MIGLLTSAQEWLYWLSAAVLVASVVMMWIPRPVRVSAPALMRLGLLLLTVSVVMRWVVTGHPPIFGTFENSIASTWCIVVGVLFGRRAFRVAELPDDFERWFSLWIPVTLAFGAFFTRTPYPLTISERSIMVDIHVVFAWAGYTLLIAASTIAGLVVARRDGWDSEPADAVMVRAAGVGFAMFTAMIALGSFYSYLLFADWFKWEIVESFALAAWLGYSSVLHVRMFFAWRGTRLAWVLLMVLPLLLGTFWVWSIFTRTYHHFEIPEIRA